VYSKEETGRNNSQRDGEKGTSCGRTSGRQREDRVTWNPQEAKGRTGAGRREC